MAIGENTTLVRRFYEEVINSRALDAIHGMVATTFVHNGEARGPSGQRRAIQELLTAFPDVRVAIDDVVAEGDRVVARQTWRGPTEARSWGSHRPDGQRPGRGRRRCNWRTIGSRRRGSTRMTSGCCGNWGGGRAESVLTTERAGRVRPLPSAARGGGADAPRRSRSWR